MQANIQAHSATEINVQMTVAICMFCTVAFIHAYSDAPQSSMLVICPHVLHIVPYLQILVQEVYLRICTIFHQHKRVIVSSSVAQNLT